MGLSKEQVGSGGKDAEGSTKAPRENEGLDERHQTAKAGYRETNSRNETKAFELLALLLPSSDHVVDILFSNDFYSRLLLRLRLQNWGGGVSTQHKRQPIYKNNN